MARKPNWKRRGITAAQAIRKSKAVDNAYAQLSRVGAMHPVNFYRLCNPKVL
jgi:hypothetical protein